MKRIFFFWGQHWNAAKEGVYGCLRETHELPVFFVFRPSALFRRGTTKFFGDFLRACDVKNFNSPAFSVEMILLYDGQARLL